MWFQLSTVYILFIILVFFFIFSDLGINHMVQILTVYTSNLLKTFVMTKLVYRVAIAENQLVQVQSHSLTCSNESFNVSLHLSSKCP